MKKKIGVYPEDTIAAISTPVGVGGIGIIKLSGPDSLDVVSEIFVPAKKKDIKKVKNYTLHYGWIKDKGTDDLVDEVLISIMKGPHSYTKEDVVEIHSHAGQIVLNKILELVLSKGVRLADPGEFTKRAFLSGRIDLVQAESVLDIINAKSDKHLSISLFQLKGDLSFKIKEIEDKIEEMVVRLEASVSFPEEETSLSKKELKKRLTSVSLIIEDLLKDSDKLKFLREGVKCVICGKSNVGKSSLLNMLLKEERVIVTPVAGTTRDIIEETINVRGLPIKISDTAGIINPRDLIEEKAIQQSYKKIDQADLILLVFDGSEKLDDKDKLIMEKTNDKNRLFIINKIDLKQKIKKDALKKVSNNLVEISATKEKGFKELENAIVNSIWKGFDLSRKEPSLVSNLRHINLLKQVNQIINMSKQEHDYSADFILFSLEEAASKIAQISGKEFSGDILDSVFNDFCIGK